MSFAKRQENIGVKVVASAGLAYLIASGLYDQGAYSIRLPLVGFNISNSMVFAGAVAGSTFVLEEFGQEVLTHVKSNIPKQVEMLSEPLVVGAVTPFALYALSGGKASLMKVAIPGLVTGALSNVGGSWLGDRLIPE
jgi:hypothetical protein